MNLRFNRSGLNRATKFLKMALRSAVFTIAILNQSAFAEDRDVNSADRPAEASGSSPNIIWILLDACKATHLSCYGYERETSPNIDRLAARGILFENAYTQATVTVLSVPSMHTGRYFPVCSFDPVHWRAQSRIRPENELMLSEILGSAGYFTEVITAHPGISEKSEFAGTFDVHRRLRSNDGSYYAEFVQVNHESVLPFLDEPRDSPFFLYLHTLDTHAPHYVHNGHDMWVDRSKRIAHSLAVDRAQEEGDPLSLKTNAGKLYYRGAYDGSIHYADHQIGVIVSKLEDLGILDNTIILITSDHGDLLAEDGSTIGHPNEIVAEQLIHVPLILAGGGLPEGVRISQRVENADIVPSMVDYLAIDTVADFDGKSFMPLVSDADAPPLHRYTFFKSRFSYRSEDQPTIIGLSDEDFTYEYNPYTEAEYLWTAPNFYPDRLDAIALHPAEAAERKQWLQDHVLPLWDRYDALPRRDPQELFEFFIEAFESGRLTPVDAIVTDPAGSDTDGKWILTERNFINTCWEDAPPLTITMEIPDGRYRARVEMMLGVEGARRTSSVSVKAQDDAEFWILQPDDQIDEAVADGVQRRVWVDLKEYDVSDGVFRITFKDGDPRYYAWIRGIYLSRVATAGQTESGDIMKGTQEELRALGYL